MSWFRRLLVVLVAFGVGVLADAIGVGAWIQRF
jgi:hypothetical protein